MFADTYGDYFVTGEQNQDYMRIEYNYDAYQSASKDTMADLLGS